MRTTLDLPDALLAEAQAATGSATKTDTIVTALRTVVRQAAARRLAALGGKIPAAAAPPRRRPAR